MTKARIRRETITGISDDAHLAKFQKLLNQKYSVKVEPPTQEHMVLRTKIRLDSAAKTPISLSIFSTDTLLFQASQKIPEKVFEREIESVLSLGRQSVAILVKQITSPTTLRAKQLLKYVQGLNSGHEVERMVIVFLCDIVVDLLLIEKLRSFNITDRQLLESYIPIKLKALRRKITIPRNGDLESLHTMRNGIAHGAALISKGEADWARDLVSDLFQEF